MKKITCMETERWLSLRQDAQATDSGKPEPLQRHLEGCISCQRFAASLPVQKAMLEQMIGKGSREPADGVLIAGALEKWERNQPSPGLLRLPATGRVWATAGWVGIAAGTTLIGLAFWQSRPPVPGENAPESSLAVAPREPAPSKIPTSQPVARQSIARQSITRQPARKAGKPAPIKPAPIFRAVVTTPGDDLAYINGDPAGFARRWTHLPVSELQRIEAEIRASVKGGDDFVEVPLPLLASTDRSAIRSALAVYRYQREIVDPRLQRRVRLEVKRQSFADLCEYLTRETGISFSATRSVADDKITVFCKNRPLRDVMRAITELYNFTWERSGEEGEFTYRLKQPLKAQLLEEELRNKDRNEALLGLDREMEKYKPFLDLTPEEAKRAAETAVGDEKKVLESLAGSGWGPAHLYHGLSSDELNALRNGQPVLFSSTPGAGELPLPDGMSGSILAALDQMGQKIAVDSRGKPVASYISGTPPPGTTEIPVSQAQNPSVTARLDLYSGDLGRLRLQGNSGVGLDWEDGKGEVSRMGMVFGAPLAVGSSPSAQNPENARANQELKNLPELQAQTQARVEAVAEALTRGEKQGEKQKVVTSADVLEAIYKATGRDIIGDYYTRLYPTDLLPPGKQPLFDLLCQTADRMGARWHWQDRWISFRSTSFFNDRLKEIPNRLLERWAKARKRQGEALTLPDLVEMTRSLSDTQLNAAEMGRAIEALYGIAEWSLVSYPNLRDSWRLLGNLPEGQLAPLTGREGLSFAQLPLLQQQQYVLIALGQQQKEPVMPADLAGATLGVEYEPARSQPAEDGKSVEKKPARLKFIYRYGTPEKGISELTLGPGSVSRSVADSSEAPRAGLPQLP